MQDHEIRAEVARALADAAGADTSALKENRQKALDLFFGRPLGNEVEGRSAVVSRDLAETILWIMPSLLRVFAQKDVVTFDPVGPEDEKQAHNESLLVNHVFMKQNSGFMVLHDWFFDALLQKVGYVKVWHETKMEWRVEEYSGLTDAQLTKLISAGGERIKVLEYEARQEEVEDPTTGQTTVATYHDLRIRRSITKRQVKVQGVPPEEILVYAKTRGSVQNAPEVFHLITTTRSELIRQGYDRKRVEKLTSYDLSVDIEEGATRDTVEDTAEVADRDELNLVEAYMCLDVDDDGIAELRKLLIAGNEILENDEFDHIPFASLTPIPLPHRHLGMSYYDLLEDLVLIKTALTRQLLDNAYLSNNNRWAADQNNVNLRDLMTSRPGGIIRTNGNPAAVLQPIQPIPIINRIAPVIDYVDSVKENRAGVGRITQGLDANVLQNSTKGAFDVATNKAAERIEAIARIFAETGVKDLFLLIHRQLRKHQDWPLKIKLGGEWLEENPFNWEDRTDLTIMAGLGNNTREEIRQNLGLLGQLQTAIIDKGMGDVVTPQNVFSLATRMQKELGFESMPFFSDPSQAKPKPPQPNPLLEVAKIESQTELQKAQLKAQTDSMKAQGDRALKIAEMELQHNVDLAEAGIGAELERERIAATERSADRDRIQAAAGQPGVPDGSGAVGVGNPLGNAPSGAMGPG